MNQHILTAQQILNLHQKVSKIIGPILVANLISESQFLILGEIRDAENSCLTMTDISRKAHTSTASATGMVDRLEKLKLVVRLHARDDRRKVYVQLSANGARLIAQCEEAVAVMAEYLNQAS